MSEIQNVETHFETQETPALVAGVSLSALTLTNFRNYSSLSLELSPDPVILTGPNGAGKTNLLEAISLLAPGRGMRRARVTEIDRADPHSQNPLPLPWAVTAHVRLPDGERATVGTGRDPETTATGLDRRMVRVDGKAASQNTLAEMFSVVWVSPQQSLLFQEGASARRKFFDKLVCSFEPDHASHVTAYEQSMRERNQLLQDRRGDAAWFNALEQKMAEHAVVVAAFRLELMVRLNQIIAQSIRSFPKALLSLSGVVEDLLKQNIPAVAAEERYREVLRASRVEDGYTGRTEYGIHKSEWGVTHTQKQMDASQCSTGEQKALLLSIILAQARSLAVFRSLPPLLLLDEVVAHLDLKRRAELVEEILELKLQAWLTGTDAETFDLFEKKAQFFLVSDASVCLQKHT